MFVRPSRHLCTAFGVQTGTLHRCLSRVVDAWAQPAEISLFNNVPEVGRLLKQSHSPFDQLKDLGPSGLNDLAEASGVEKVLLSAWERPGMTALSNETIYSYTSAFPARFVGIGSVNIAHPMKAIKEVEKCVKEYGFKGIRVLPWLWDKPPTTNLFYPIFAKCAELGIPFCTQVCILCLGHILVCGFHL